MQAEVVEGSLFGTYLKLTWGAVKKSLESLREKPDRNRCAPDLTFLPRGNLTLT